MDGTYSLPEAQSDRFMFNIRCPYPNYADEIEIVWTTTGDSTAVIDKVFEVEEIIEIQRLVRTMPVSREVVGYAVRLAARSRPEDHAAPGFIRELVRWGAGPRASQYLIIGAKARALFEGKPCVDYDDVRSVAADVLCHRVMLAFRAKAQRVTVDEVVERMLKEVPERG
jgi:MoxR-like ATPase